MPRKISLVYFGLGFVYIALSDVLLSLYHGRNLVENFPIVSASVMKGWLFILVTSLLLYFVLSKYINRLNDHRDLLNTVVNNTRDLLWMLDRKYTILLANSTFANALEKQSGKDLKGQNALDFAGDKSNRELWKSYYNRAMQGEVFSVEHTWEKPGEEAKHIDFFFYPVRNPEGQVDKVACFGHDITGLKKVQKETEYQNNALKEITWIQSHELRKPVANIQGLLQALDTEHPDNPENAQLIEHIREQSDEMDQVIRKIVERANSFE